MTCEGSCSGREDFAGREGTRFRGWQRDEKLEIAGDGQGPAKKDAAARGERMGEGPG